MFPPVNSNNQWQSMVLKYHEPAFDTPGEAALDTVEPITARYAAAFVPGPHPAIRVHNFFSRTPFAANRRL